jgi:hypothetical protein
MLQYLIVGLIVGAAVLYSAWAVLPAGLRGTAAARLARLAMRSGIGEASARNLQSRLGQAGSCSECAQCRGCASGGGASRSHPSI